MKKLEFETSKGRFCIKDVPDILNGDVFYGKNKNKGISLKEITEEQASDIVDETNEIHMWTYKHYGFIDQVLFKATDSLHSLLKSKGIHLFDNPFNSNEYEGATEAQKQRAEQKTFYNPYIFKINE